MAKKESKYIAWYLLHMLKVVCDVWTSVYMHLSSWYLFDCVLLWRLLKMLDLGGVTYLMCACSMLVCALKNYFSQLICGCSLCLMWLQMLQHCFCLCDFEIMCFENLFFLLYVSLFSLHICETRILWCSNTSLQSTMAMPRIILAKILLKRVL
jgi:hypothetical protein